jgi:dihydrofolate synthase / folylpolyglutamate synthase
MAFLAMSRAAVDMAVVEVGMGGRLDSTNVVVPDVAIITNVAMDHAQYLGDDLTTIAGEKAGIIKAGVPVVTGSTSPEVLAVLERRAREVGAELHVVPPPDAAVDATGPAWSWTRSGAACAPGPPGRAGTRQRTWRWRCARWSCCPRVRRPDRAAVVAGVAATHWPGRVQIERRGATTWIFDVAHNAAGVESLLERCPTSAARPVVALIGVLGDKDWGRMLPPLFAYADAVVLTEPPSAPRSGAGTRNRSSRRWRSGVGAWSYPFAAAVAPRRPPRPRAGPWCAPGPSIPWGTPCSRSGSRRSATTGGCRSKVARHSFGR